MVGFKMYYESCRWKEKPILLKSNVFLDCTESKIWVSSVLQNQFMPAARKQRLTHRYDLISEISINNMAGFILALP